MNPASASREAISAALFALVSGSATYKTKSRRIKIWDQVPQSSKPAIFMTEHEEDEVQPGRGLPGKTTLGYEFYIYIANLDPNTIGSAILNPLLDAIDVVLAPNPVTGFNTLGGLVSHCWKEGRTIKDPGDLDGNGLAVIPVKVLVP